MEPDAVSSALPDVSAATEMADEDFDASFEAEAYEAEPEDESPYSFEPEDDAPDSYEQVDFVPDEVEPEPEVGAAQSADAHAGDDDDEDDDGLEEEPPRDVMPRRVPVDTAALSVLREEAAREQEVRRAEASGLEFQGELDMAAPETGDAEGAARLQTRAPVRVEPTDTMPPEPTDPAERPAPRRDMLPDVEEINSTLQPVEMPVARKSEREAEPSRGSGQRYGMSLVFLAAAVATMVYSQAERLSGALPQAAPMLESYVGKVDSGRIWLDGILRNTVDKVDGDG
ncbi:hypothetical protein R3X27_11775 [Tropicimonas sp. TH_r6]|uniref:hypothetical protein n=1 Tax=Tropicimonas sp. TH_r6 TaxID=3082085 RepID=UPI0029536F32|nr:hypothetical protein [Tropicimonas sp. TH_r6]MDV7143362.1 hypothetical protein [Tropicimonas sp. TH_r6]